MRRLNARANHEQILDNLDTKLPELDSKRAGMYADLSSDIRVDRVLLDHVKESIPSEMRLVNMNLTSIGHLCLLAGHLKHLDLSENRLKSAERLRQFPLLEYLTLNQNEITSVDCLGQGMDNLEFLSIASNGLNSVGQLAGVKGAKKLGRIVFCENPICDDKEKLEELRGVFPSVRLIPFWLV
jgi:Leucine-rich repeat (LRR) protein